MSQSDYDLTTADANTGVTVRAGWNAMLQALASNNSGASAPATTFPYMWWPDTTSGYMKQRNAADTDWLIRWQLSTGQLAALSGATFTGLVNLAAGADIASAATINLTASTGNCPRITGTVATSAVTMNTGQQMTVVADGAWPLTYHATTNKLNTGGQNYTCQAGDQVLYHKDLSGIVHGVIFPASGLSVLESSWGNYGPSSTVVGWVSFTNKNIYTKIVGKTVFVSFYISGVSNSVSASFTLPYAAVAGTAFYGSLGASSVNDSVEVPDGTLSLAAGSTNVVCYPSSAAVNWTASGTKIVSGTFTYQIS